MNNKRKYIISAVLVVAIIIACILVWWFGKSEGQRDAVPDDAVAAMRLDFKALLKQAEIDRDKLRDVDNKTGIDFSQTVYGFVTRDGNIGITAAMNDEDDLDDRLLDKRQRSGLTYGMLGSFMACHDGNKVMLMGPMANMNDETLMDQMAFLMNKDKCTLALLASAEKSEAPLSIRTSVNALPKKLRTLFLPTSMTTMPDDALQIQLEGSMKDNRISMQTSILTESQGVRQHLEKIFSSLQPLTGSLVHQGPQDPVIWMALGVRGNDFLEILRSNQTIRTALLGANMCVDLDQMIKATDGDVQLSVPMLTLRKQEWIVDAQVDNADFMKNAADWDMHKMGIYFGMAGPGVLYATNSLYQMQTAYNTTPNTALMLHMKQIQGAYLYAIVNLKPLVNTMAPAMALLGYGQSFHDTVGQLNYMSMRIDEKGATIDIVLEQNISEIVNQWKK